MSLRSTAGSLRARLKVHLRSGNRIEQAVYFATFSNAYRREQAVVSRGHRQYNRAVAAGEQEYLLRRNIHMIEKGLTMRPRRKTFALDYISQTIALFASISGRGTQVTSEEVINWAREVLTRYFQATAESDSEKIAVARAAFDSIDLEGEPDGVSGPHEPFTGESPVSIDDLLALAVRRKSIRWYESHAVPRELVDRAVEVAAQAPSACNRQPFTFRIFDDPDLVQKVAKIPMGTAGYGQSLQGLVVIVGDMSAFIDERDRHLIYTDGCLAAMSFILGLETQGIGSVCINWPDIAEREARMRALLRLEPFERVVMLVGYGYADQTGHTPFSAKRPLHALRSYNKI